MARLSEPIPSERAMIPAAPRGLMRPARPLPVSPRLALGIAASAAGTIFVKRLVELVAEEVYHRVRRTPVSQRTIEPRRGGQRRRRAWHQLPPRPEEDLPTQDVTPLAPSGGILWVRIVRVWRILPTDHARD